MILLALLAMLVTVVVVTVIRDKKNNYHGPLHQCVLDVQHGEIDQCLNDSLDGTSYATTCKTMLAINQTKRCYSDDIIVKLVNVDLHKVATVTIELIPMEYERGCDFYWNVTAIVDLRNGQFESFEYARAFESFCSGNFETKQRQ